jgi:hypothetical protein
MLYKFVYGSPFSIVISCYIMLYPSINETPLCTGSGTIPRDSPCLSRRLWRDVGRRWVKMILSLGAVAVVQVNSRGKVRKLVVSLEMIDG